MTDTASGQTSCCAPTRERGAASAPTAPAGPATAQPRSPDAIAVPGGLSVIGTDRPVLAVDGEGPARKVKIKPFRMDRCAVTNARFAEFVDDTGYVTEAERIGDSFVFEGHLAAEPFGYSADASWWRAVKGADWRRINGPGSEGAWVPEHPVVHVSWADANAFASWAGGRLPAEAEWEHAARGGLGDVRYPWGDDEPDDEHFLPCNIWQGRFPDLNTEQDGYAATAPAASFAPNGYGLLNMVGNTWEWTAEVFRVRSLKRAARDVHAGKRGYRLLKGGSFLCHRSYCHRYRIAARTGNSPDSTTSHQGFRLVYDAEVQPSGP